MRLLTSLYGSYVAKKIVVCFQLTSDQSIEVDKLCLQLQACMLSALCSESGCTR